jgi:ribosomal protein L7/L12
VAYFQSYSNYFWQWEELQSVISIPGESTIAYTDYAAEVIKQLAPQGLPPFGSLLLAVVATNPRALPSLEEIDRIIKIALNADYHETLTEAMSFLQTLNSLPEDYKSGPKRLLVFQAIFTNCHYKIAVTKSRMQQSVITQRTFPKRVMAKEPFTKNLFLQDFRVIALLNKRYPTPTSIINQIAGIPDLPEELILEESSPKPAEDLVNELIENVKTFHVGSLVKRIWSGLNIPVHSSLPSQQPLGGFSDITNKGDFDKLLLSEFANEDLLFMTRLANNEALYIQREVPPETNKLERVILVDVSLKNWGTPKTIAFATMLAIAKHPKTTISCKAYVLGNDLHPLSIDSVHTIIDGLQIVEGGLHPARGLDAFFKQFPSPENREVFVITEPSTLKQGEMLRAMQVYQPLINYVIYTDADGNIDVYKKQQNSKKHLQHVLLPLQTLWQKPKSKAPEPLPLQDRGATQTDLPILIKSPLNSRHFISASDGEVFQVTNDRMLLRFYSKDSKYYEKGWEVICEHLPVLAGEFEIGVLEDKSYLLLMFDPQTKNIHLQKLSDNSTIVVPFPYWKSNTPTFVFRDGAFLYRTYQDSGWRIQANGRIEETNAPGFEYFKDRREEMKKLSAKAYAAGGALKNIDTVYINREGNLVLNIHALRLSQGKYLLLDRPPSQDRQVQAVRNDRDHFVFPDGSQVRVKRCGMIALKSSNTALPEIYIPTLIDVTLGAATDTTFAGNTFYYREPLYELRLLKAGGNKLKLIKQIKDINHESLVAVKDLVEAAPGIICRYITEQKARELKRELETEGTETELVRMHSTKPEQRVMETKEFFQLYIQRFTEIISEHGS